MNFLLKLVFAAGCVSPVVAASNDDSRVLPFDTDKVLVESGDRINNPYALADKPFTIATEAPNRVAAPAAAAVLCGGETWVHGDLLGRTNDDQPVYTHIVENRVYLNWNGKIESNIDIIYNLKGGRYPHNSTNEAIIKGCINRPDPSTAPQNLLGTTGDGRITCNGHVMDNLGLLGVFVQDGRSTYQYTKYVNGKLYVMIKQGIDDERTTNYNMSLMPETINKEHGSYMASKWDGVFTRVMLDGCYWPGDVKTGTIVNQNNCESGPTLSGITNITQTALRFTFTGNGISTVKWRIESGNTELRSGTTADLAGGKTVNINFNSLAPGNYSLEIEGASCTSTISRRDFTINEPVVTIPDCVNGPAVSSFSSITPQSMTVNFGGDNLRTFSWRILQGSYAVASGATGKLGGNSAPVTFNYLKNGTYTFEMRALDCKAPAVATRNFSVSATDTRTACPKGPTMQSLISSGDTRVEFLFDGEGIYAIDWKILNDQNVAVRQNRVAPQNNHPIVDYAKLPNGVYTMQIQGGLCKSTATAERFSIGVPLPIYVSHFKGEVVEKGVELSWEVVSEQDGKEFEILRYDDKLKNEEVLGTVSLTDQRTGWYKFVDESPLLGNNYYQLKQIDIDGTFTKSKVISVNPGIIQGTVVAPNPAQDYVDIQFSSRSAGQTEVLIYNAAGVNVGSSPIRISEGKNVHRINVKRLVSGSYFMKISHSGQISSLRFTKLD
ncbi:T9SS type A sorting domain-containing protein [Dyadobacter aurulentus]|uniref:T9SS type A sorting domain-containing protein n=1 Tax=Dyadobacter sp. UC 10 TaxID=2605428 RepID=UPI0011F35CE3|nr:T9SS type A sorting domain-containing protein [Dyadobacter sp. UC 10]KAA0991584.1 T9SS type A sorting domain-containing protein [Dyadobacter sp. UC 10]